MHPLIAAFLDVRSALDVIDRAEKGAMLGPDEAAFAAAAKAHPELASEVKKGAGRSVAPEDSQNATILLGVRAALSTVPQDPALGPGAKTARAALEAAGAEREQIEQLLGGVLVEEAFTGDNDPTHFDADFVKESFAELPQLAKLDEDAVENLIEAFTHQAPAAQRPMFVGVAETLFQSAWGEGTQSVNVEHVEDALQSLAPDDPTELEAIKTALEVLLRFLSVHKLVGPLRLERLLTHLKAWTAAKPEDDGAIDDDDEEDEDEVDEKAN